MAGGIEAIAASISADLVLRLPRQNKKQREGLALLMAAMLDVRRANLMDLSASLPREAERIDMRYQYISRLLGNEHIDVDWVMAPFAREVLINAAKNKRKLIIIIDQSKYNDTQQVVVVALRVGGRSLPVSWRVKETEGAIGFPEQRAALDVTRVSISGCATRKRYRRGTSHLAVSPSVPLTTRTLSWVPRSRRSTASRNISKPARRPG